MATALIRHGERTIAERYSTAWLAVAVGNARARRFYERQGWSDVAALDYPAETAASPIVVPCRRYEKVVRLPPEVGCQSRCDCPHGRRGELGFVR